LKRRASPPLRRLSAAFADGEDRRVEHNVGVLHGRFALLSQALDLVVLTEEDRLDPVFQVTQISSQSGL
jgi:hypothetical protein